MDIDPDDQINALKNVLLNAAVEAQEHYGNDKRAVVLVMNALADTLIEYTVRATGPKLEDAQKRYDELATPMSKVMQEFLTQHTGGCVIIERKPDEKEGRS
jgi:hypothetical protein